MHSPRNACIDDPYGRANRWRQLVARDGSTNPTGRLGVRVCGTWVAPACTSGSHCDQHQRHETSVQRSSLLSTQRLPLMVGEARIVALGASSRSPVGVTPSVSRDLKAFLRRAQRLSRHVGAPSTWRVRASG